MRADCIGVLGICDLGALVSATWVHISMRAHIDGGMTLYCPCGRKLKQRNDDDKGHYCRRHGLQAVLDKVVRW
jgi:hypothetical protein